MKEQKIFILVFIHASFRFFSFFASVKLRRAMFLYFRGRKTHRIRASEANG